MVSDRFHFICLLIAKNASSTLRQEFNKAVYDSYEVGYSEIDPRVRDRYFTFATLRNPITRLPSAYQEISLRFEMNPSPNPRRRFFLMDDTSERFDAFLDALDDACWDAHLLPQVNSLAGVRIDFFICMERLQEGVREVFDRLDMGTCPTLPFRRSRQERKQVYDYARFLLSRSDLNARALSRIKNVYETDIQLYGQLFPQVSSSHYSLAEGVAFQELGIGEDTVVVNVETGQIFACNATATLLLKHFQAGDSLDAATDALFNKYQVDRATVERELRALVDKLLSVELVVVANDSY